jgi:hypothetical protein
MKIKPGHREAFAAYIPSLEMLEKTFRKAGAGIVFDCYISPSLGKAIWLWKGGNLLGSVCIEGDSPIQAVKDVTAKVICDWADSPVAAGI